MATNACLCACVRICYEKYYYFSVSWSLPTSTAQNFGKQNLQIKKFKLHIVTEFKVTIISLSCFGFRNLGGAWVVISNEIAIYGVVCAFRTSFYFNILAHYGKIYRKQPLRFAPFSCVKPDMKNMFVNAGGSLAPISEKCGNVRALFPKNTLAVTDPNKDSANTSTEMGQLRII